MGVPTPTHHFLEGELNEFSGYVYPRGGSLILSSTLLISFRYFCGRGMLGFRLCPDAWV